MECTPNVGQIISNIWRCTSVSPFLFGEINAIPDSWEADNPVHSYGKYP